MASGIPMEIPCYEIRDFKVYFGNQYLPDARWSDFKDLGQGYAKDGHHVFFMGQIMNNADPVSFQVLDNTYAEDKQHVFQYGRIIYGLRPRYYQPTASSSNESMFSQTMSSISAPIPPYEIRDFKVFFSDRLVPEARWIDFTNLGQGYGKDVRHVFFLGKLIAIAHSYSFEVLKNGYAKDKNYVFYNGQIVQGLTPHGFHIP